MVSSINFDLVFYLIRVPDLGGREEADINMGVGK